MLTAALLIPLPAAGHEDDSYEFGGSGWGHSIGLSQYGAYGQALEGRTASEILGHYYPGVEVQSIASLVDAGEIGPTHPLVTDTAPLWVGVLQNARAMTFTPVDGEVRFCQVVGTEAPCVNLGRAEDGSPETWELAETEVPGECLLLRVDPPALDGEEPVLGTGACRVSIIWGEAELASRVGVNGAKCEGPSGFGRNCFNRGALRIRAESVEGGFHVALEVGLEEYLYGLGEMPSSWPEEALEAQAVAGRTYATYRLLGNERPDLATSNDAGLTDARKAACWCHIYSTVRDQNYVGYAKEGEPGASGGSRWMAAVDATAGEVVTHPTATSAHSTVVIAFYHSSSGGVTETNTTVWGTTPQPYLQSVDDQWSNLLEVGNPYREWTRTVSAGELAEVLGWDSVSDVELARGAPAASFTFAGRADGQVIEDTVTAAQLYAALGTRSPHIDSVSVDRFYPFLDMEGSVHTGAIFAIWEAGITSGCGGDYYCPDVELTRAQMATFLARALQLEPIIEPRFDDVAVSSVHAPNINAIAEAGISLGCSSDGVRFCPDDPVSRAQMASFLTRALGLSPVGAGPFTDLESAAGHQRNINALWLAGITSGCSADGTRYCPDDPVIRGQMASFLARAFLG